jgi:hypothetical protein
MTARRGDFADRGVHRLRKNGIIVPLLTPSVTELHCVGCRTRGVTVILVREDPELDWAFQECYCDVPCAIEHGVTFPPPRPPNPRRRPSRRPIV